MFCVDKQHWQNCTAMQATLYFYFLCVDNQHWHNCTAVQATLCLYFFLCRQTALTKLFSCAGYVVSFFFLSFIVNTCTGFPKMHHLHWSTVLWTSLGKTFFVWYFILDENILFWLTISYQKPFVFSVSVFCCQIFTLKLNLRPKVGLTHAFSIVKWFFGI